MERLINGKEIIRPKVSGLELLKNAGALLFDIDQSIADSSSVVIDRSKKLFDGQNNAKFVNDLMRISRIAQWDQLANWYIRLGLSYQEACDLNQAMWSDPDVLGSALPVPGAEPLVQWLECKGKKLLAATSRPDVCRNGLSMSQVTRDWIDTWFPEISSQNVSFKEASDFRTGAEYKGDTLALASLIFGPTVMVEDSPEQAEVILKRTRGTSTHVILVPVGKIPVPNCIMCDPRATVLKRPQDQGIWEVYKFLSGDRNVAHY